jgi:sulfur-carrier protein
MVHVRLFAGLKDLAKRSSVEVPWESSLTVAGVREELTRQSPALRSLLERSKAAIDDQMADDQAAVPDNAEVAFLPPVSGG